MNPIIPGWIQSISVCDCIYLLRKTHTRTDTKQNQIDINYSKTFVWQADCVSVYERARPKKG